MASSIFGTPRKPPTPQLFDPQDYAPVAPVEYEQNAPADLWPVEYEDPGGPIASAGPVDPDTSAWYAPTQAPVNYSAPLSGAAPAPTADPFAAMGGGVQVNGGWVPANHPNAQQAAPQTMTPTTGTTPASSQTAPVAPTAPPQTVQQATQAALLQLLQTPQGVSSESVTQHPAMSAYRLQSQRAEERQRAALAERAAYEGWDDSGAFDTEVQGLAQARGEGEAGYAGQLALIQMEDQKERLIQGLNFALQTGDNASARDLQQRLAELQAQIQREGLGFNYTQLQQQANQQALLALLAGV